MSNGFTPTPRVKVALDNKKLELTAPSTAEGKTASLTWQLVKNNPRIIVWTRDPQDMTEKNGNGKIQAELDLPVLFSALEVIEQAVSEQPGWRLKLENKNYIFPGGKRSEHPVVKSEIWIGKDKEGFVYISVTAPNRPVIKFRIAPGDFHCWYRQSGEPLPAEEVSKLYVRGYVRILRDIYNQLAVDHFVDVMAEKAQQQQGQGGGKSYGGNRGGYGGNSYGGGNSGGNQGGGYSKPASSDAGFGNDDDLPF